MKTRESHHHEDHPGQGFRRGSNLYFLAMGLAAIIWVVVRVIPKPSRVTYPCMRVAMSLASGMLIQLGGVAISLLTLRKARETFKMSNYRLAAVMAIAAVAVPLIFTGDVQQAEATIPASLHAANQPIGVAKGIFPGRVVWVHDSTATNINCVPDQYSHGWFLSENSNQASIDRMVSTGLQTVTGRSSDSAAWDALFHFHNTNAGKGDIGYQPGEKIFIKINATSSWSGNFNPTDLSKVQNSYYGISETSPQVVLSVLRQLVNVAKVSQANILVGDPLRHIYKHCYDLWHPEFPGVHYLDHDGLAGREKVIASQTAVVHYSDRGKILHTSTGTPTVSDHLYTVFDDAAYLVDIPMLKGHAYAGMTAFAKNHFGSQTRADASHLHNGLVSPPTPDSLRNKYGLYRVQVDLMSHHLLGGKNLVFILDALWATDHELDKPVKWAMPPFNNDWMSSIFCSLDEVAIESVGYDFLRSEFTPARGLATYVQQVGVDDYLHQAADSTTWPAGIMYDPDSTGSPIPSIGVHEHWNNLTDMQYSRNLGTGSGIELLRMPQVVNGITETIRPARTYQLYSNYPNPFNPSTIIGFELLQAGRVTLRVFDVQGREVATIVEGTLPAGFHTRTFDGSGLASGMYFYRLIAGSFIQTRKMLLLR
jgi:hypothetical protein